MPTDPPIVLAVRMYICMYVGMVIIYSKSNDESRKVANSARGQLNRGKMNTLLTPIAPENLVLRDGFGSPVPRQPAHLHTKAESGACLRDSQQIALFFQGH